jgi:CMP-N,N'-diacetyllegionaminic acid synthase
MPSVKNIVAMIPARMGSRRVPRKNIRLIAGKPLIAHAIEAARQAVCFGDIYVNSEAEIIGQIAQEYGVKFYRRPEEFSSDKTVNDEFVYDFMRKIKGDILVQLLCTSPLITPREIGLFVETMVHGDYDTLVSVNSHKIACVYQEKPVNFSTRQRHKSSQDMTPVQSYASVLMAWKYDMFLENMRKHDFAYHGADGKTGYHELKGFSTIDIDQEEDFALAEVALAYRSRPQDYPKRYYQPVHPTGKHP